MRVSVQRLAKSKIEVKIEVPTEEFNRFREKAVFNLGRDLELPGFRKGKVPKEIIEREIGQDKILTEASQICIEENYLKAVLENKIEAISQPEIEILKLAPGNPFEFKANVWVMPEIKLPDYKKIASETKKREISVSEEEIEKLKLEKERVEKERVRQEIIEKIAQITELETPEILVTEEQNRMLEGLKKTVPQTLQINFEDYLTRIGKSEKELLDSLLPEAQKRVRASLVLREIGKKENIGISDQEAEEEVNKILKYYPEAEKIKKDLDPQKLKEYTKEGLRNEKTLQFLESFI